MKDYIFLDSKLLSRQDFKGAWKFQQFQDVAAYFQAHGLMSSILTEHSATHDRLQEMDILAQNNQILCAMFSLENDIADYVQMAAETGIPVVVVGKAECDYVCSNGTKCSKSANSPCSLHALPLNNATVRTMKRHFASADCMPIFKCSTALEILSWFKSYVKPFIEKRVAKERINWLQEQNLLLMAIARFTFNK